MKNVLSDQHNLSKAIPIQQREKECSAYKQSATFEDFLIILIFQSIETR